MNNQKTETADIRAMQHRSRLLLGDENLERLGSVRVLMFGVGGVGSWCAEGLVRCGIRHITLVDSDVVCVTNCNRQLMATSKTIGMVKVEALRERLLEINPEAEVTAICKVYDETTADSFHMEDYDFIIDAIDSLKSKAHLILRATSLPRHITLISSLGAARRTDPLKVRATEFWKVKGDALARALRNRFKKEKTFPARKFMCVYSEEVPMANLGNNADGIVEDQWSATKIQPNGSLCHVTSVFGMVIASLVINKITANEG
ncbi:MAG: tRNA threonylcarbamoyladenosine dehydratase [Bacteroidales bacterium]|nr:tRNA threonylcarbamoyladenosine dehydratase [Candidatus Liminaster caballi]